MSEPHKDGRLVKDFPRGKLDIDRQALLQGCGHTGPRPRDSGLGLPEEQGGWVTGPARVDAIQACGGSVCRSSVDGDPLFDHYLGSERVVQTSLPRVGRGRGRRRRLKIHY